MTRGARLRRDAGAPEQGAATIAREGTRRPGPARGALHAWWMLGAEASVVLPLRLLRLAGLDEAAREEARLMVSEKLWAQVELARRLATGSLGGEPGEFHREVARHYLGYVRANRRRLVAAMRQGGERLARR